MKVMGAEQWGCLSARQRSILLLTAAGADDGSLAR